MVITPSSLDFIFSTLSQKFRDSYMEMPAPLLDSIGSKVPSNSRDQRYPIVQSITGAMRQWNDERQPQNLVVDAFTVTNLKWENTVAIDRTDIEFDQYGVYSSMIIPNLARHARLLPDQQIAALITANPTAYDGRSFFATNHYINPAAKSGSQSNSATGKPLNATNLALIQAGMMGFKGPDGIPLGCYGDTLLVPNSLKYAADTLANASFYPEAKNGTAGATFAAQSNVMQGQYRVVVSPYLDDTGDPATAVWYLLDCRAAELRPFFWQEHTAPQINTLVDPNSPTVFFQDKFYMGARALGAAAAALWFKAYKVSGA